MTPQPLFTFQTSTAQQDGSATSEDKQYQWASWHFWDITKPYLTFISLHPKSIKDTSQCEQIERWLGNWERHADRQHWKCGGYVIASLFSRIAHSTKELRRLHQSGADIASPRAADACLVFARNPSCSLVVMLPGIDDAIDIREAHQTLILDALVGLHKPIAVVIDGKPERWER